MMFKKIPSIVFLFVLAIAAVAVPLACSSSSTTDGVDAPAEKAAVDMTTS
jgi:hypothetical protein